MGERAEGQPTEGDVLVHDTAAPLTGEQMEQAFAFLARHNRYLWHEDMPNTGAGVHGWVFTIMGKRDAGQRLRPTIAEAILLVLDEMATCAADRVAKGLADAAAGQSDLDAIHAVHPDPA